MSGVVIGFVIATLIAFLLPPLLRRRTGVPIPNVVFHAVAILMIIAGLVSTSVVYVPDGYSAHLFRTYGGGSLPSGRIVAVNGENGPQARILSPGFHVEPLINLFYAVDLSHPEVSVPPGMVGILTARDGAPLRSGQAYADPFPAEIGGGMVDAEVFLTRGGQRGPQLNVLTPGRYRLNRYLWDVAILKA
jgi:hypothetical protein